MKAENMDHLEEFEYQSVDSLYRVPLTTGQKRDKRVKSRKVARHWAVPEKVENIT